MLDGIAVLLSMMHSLRAMGHWNDEHGTNMIDTGSHFYDAYETQDGKYVSIGAIEPQFYAEWIRIMELGDEFNEQMNPAQWPALKEKLKTVFKTKTRDEWCELLEGTETCFAPVLNMEEAPQHPHNQARETFIEVAGVLQARPAPRFSRTPCDIPEAPSLPAADTQEALSAWGFSEEEIAQLREAQAIA